jgi:phage I-like protein
MADTSGRVTAMSTAVDLDGVRRADGQAAVWLQAFPLGTYRHPAHGDLVFTVDRLERFADNIRRRVRGIDLDVDYEHKTDPAKGKRAAGWITDAEVRPDGLWIAVWFTAEAWREVRAGHWRYLSPEYQLEWTDAMGNTWRDVLFGVALTNRPFLKDLAPVAAGERAQAPVEIPTGAALDTTACPAAGGSA